MSIERKANRVLEQARQLAERVNSWADFSAGLFDCSSGLVPQTFPDEMERQVFFDSEQYAEINQILMDLMKKFGVVNGATPKEKSGRFVVRVPKTVHQNLEAEAKAEGVSLNQLAVAKLSMPLADPVRRSQAENVIVQAFNNVHGGYSRDWVILEPHHNRLFIEKCRELGLTYDEFWLNHLLMNIGKNPKNKGRLNRATKKTGFKNYDDCAFASEIVVRILQRTRGVTLDRVICDPALREQFDTTASRLAPNQTALKLRCAAFNLRKTHRLQPMDLTSDAYDLVAAGPLKTVDLSSIAAMPGGYVFYDYSRPIYAGETDDLRRRIRLHLQGGLPEWLGANDDEGFVLKFIILPNVGREGRLNWLGAFINRERPVLNYQKTA
jgi:hypothetical protein